METSRSMGITTLKRLMGYIHDDRKTNEYTLNTLAIYLGAKKWKDYVESNNVNSEWQFEDNSIHIDSLQLNVCLLVKYLDREVLFQVNLFEDKKVLKVILTKNSSLNKGDILFVERVKKGEIIVASKVIRGSNIGNYRTNSEVTDVIFK
ncbi:MAG: hypothetical protein ACRCZM_01400 [Bacteroidales bacterium]